MSKTSIEWTQEVWNPTTGCNKINPGCKFCYAEVMHKRLMVMQPNKYSRPFLDGAFEHPESLLLPLKWKKPRTIFVNSMSDLFHDNISVDYIAQVYAIMFLANQHTYQVLTKRSNRRREILNSLEFMELLHKYINQFHDKYIKRLEQELYFFDDILNGFPFKNIWEGSSTADQASLEAELPHLLETPAYVRFLSAEPLLGPLRLLQTYMLAVGKFPKGHVPKRREGLHWVITGGESGNKARPSHPDWYRSLKTECEAMKIPFFFKQWGKWLPIEQDSPNKIGPDFKREEEYTDRAEYEIELNKFLKFWKKRIQVININGLIITPHISMIEPHLADESLKPTAVYNYGKKNSGNLLDGEKHLNFPTLSHISTRDKYL